MLSHNALILLSIYLCLLPVATAVAFGYTFSVTTMDNFRGFGLGKAFRKQRTNLYRRPQNESQMLLDCPDNSSISSTPQSDSVSRASSHDIVDYGNISGTSYSNLSGTETGMNQGVEDGNSGDFCYSDTEQKDDQIDMNRFSEGYVTASHIEDPQISGTVICNNHSGLHGIVSDGAGNDNKVKKVKLKVGGVTRTIHTSVAGSSSTKSSSSSDAPQPWQPKVNIHSPVVIIAHISCYMKF